jgi:hypothetical protein
MQENLRFQYRQSYKKASINREADLKLQKNKQKCTQLI